MPKNINTDDSKDRLIQNLSARLAYIRKIAIFSDRFHMSEEMKRAVKSATLGWTDASQTKPIYTRK